jgi:hypothetical protein
MPVCSITPSTESIVNSCFAPNPTHAFSPTKNIPNFNFDGNLPTGFLGVGVSPQSSLLDLMSESLYTWPNQQGFGYSADQDLFDFSGLQDLSQMNNFNDNGDMSTFSLPGTIHTNVRLVFHGL